MLLYAASRRCQASKSADAARAHYKTERTVAALGTVWLHYDAVMGKMRVSKCVPIILLAAAVAGCTTSIRRIATDPARYRNREVKIHGLVTDSLSLAGRGVYRVDDGTASLWVISPFGVPRNGARVTAKGRIQDTFDLSLYGARVNLPRGLDSGAVMLESSHSAR